MHGLKWKVQSAKKSKKVQKCLFPSLPILRDPKID